MIGVDATAFYGVAAGISRYLYEMLKAMLAAAASDDFILYSPRPVHVPLGPGPWRTHVPREWRRHGRGRWLREDLPHLLADDGVDVFWGQSTVLPLRLLRPCRRVLTVHDLTGLLYPRSMEIRTRLYWGANFRAAVRAADVFVADSLATENLLHRLVPSSRGRTVVVHPGCPSGLTLLAPDVARQVVAEHFSLAGDFVLSVGTLEPRKDYPTLLRAVRALQGAPTLAVAGSVGWRCRGILKQVRQAEADHLVRYLGRVGDAELSALYGAARLMVYPSFYEGFGFPLLEAMARGCPVLCSWSSSLPEVGGSAASYFRPRDPADLARRLGGLLGDERRLGVMRALGLVQAARFSFDTAAGQMLGVLRGDDTVLGQPGAARIPSL